jgi:integrase
MIFQELAADYTSRQLTRPTTREHYAHLTRIAGPIRSLAVDAITRADVERSLVAARETGIAPGTVKNLLIFVRSVLRSAGNDCAAGIRVRVPAREIVVHSADDSAAVRAELEALTSDAAFGLLIMLATGIRKGELLGLRADDWVRERRQLRIARGANGQPTKSGKIRFVDVPDWLAVHLDERGPAVETNASTLMRTLDGACARAGVKRLKVHGLRHSRITQLLLKGAPVLYVAEQAGHASPAFTLEVYGHLCAATPDQRREWANL